MKTLTTVLRLSVLILFAGCAGPMGPSLGLGPGWDELAGIAILAVIVVFAYRPIRKAFSTRLDTYNSASPQNTVKGRYARGEITADEFQRIMKHLSEQ